MQAEVMRHVRGAGKPPDVQASNGDAAESYLRVVPLGSAPRVQRPPASSATVNSTPLWNARVDRLGNVQAEFKHWMSSCRSCKQSCQLCKYS